MCEQREVIRPSGMIQLNVNISGRRQKTNKLCLSPPPEGSCLLPAAVWFVVLGGEDEQEASNPLWAQPISGGCVEQWLGSILQNDEVYQRSAG